MLAKAVRLTIEAGHFRPDVDPSLFAFQLYGIVLSYYHSARLFRDPDAKVTRAGRVRVGGRRGQADRPVGRSFHPDPVSRAA